jgi:UDP-N-acetyl-D-mannosaminuronic acid dehydrogenase
MYNILERRIRNKCANIVVIGLGYVGLTLAMQFTAAGFTVFGLDTDEERVRQVNKGRWPLDPSEPVLPAILAGKRLMGITYDLPWAVTNPAIVVKADVIIVAVPTPASGPDVDLSMLSAAMGTVAGYMDVNTLLIIASTVPPKATAEFLPLLERGGMKHGEHFWVAHCPERLTAGKLWQNVALLPHVIGGVTPEAGQLAAALYEQICTGELLCTDALSAEISKVAENAYRDVQISFVNSLALMCYGLGLSY